MKRTWFNILGVCCILLGITGLFIYGINPLLPSSARGEALEEYNGSTSSNGEISNDERNQLYRYKNKFEFDNEQLTSLKVNADMGDVNIKWALDNESWIEVKGEATKDVIDRIAQAEIKGGELQLNYNYKRQSWEFIQLFNMGWQHHKHEIVIHADKDFVLKGLEADLAMGSFEIDGGRYDRMKADCDMGQMEVRNIVANYAELDAAMGQVVTDAVDAPLTVKTSMGEVDMRNTLQTIDVSSEAGSVYIEQARAHNITADSSMGSVEIRVAPEFEGSYDLKVELGDITAPESKRKSDQVIKVRSEMGSINIEEQ
ncbi:DUF4097 family beta strand repeat-containing protein [Paenibacillus marinisediminis]